MDKTKLIKTYEIFDSYEKRFARATLEKPFYIPVSEAERESIRDKVKRMLGYDEALIPEIGSIEEVEKTDLGAYTVTEARYTTWHGVYGSASLYLPKGAKKPPLAFIACGHGDGGRAYKPYRRMAERLAGIGIAVIMPDNIGQGDREPMGHKSVVSPFYAGLTLQGLIVMESIALIRHLARDDRFDGGRIASLGNSGGGTLTMLLAALCPELSVISSSGYASEFHYVLSKEKKHCSCNLLRGAASSLEPWEIYSLFAPKPLMLENGCYDNYFPMEYFERCARRTGGVYSILSAEEKFEKHLAKTKHGWDDEDIKVISAFIAKHLSIDTDLLPKEVGDVEEFAPERHIPMPEGALDTDRLCERLSGVKMPEGTRLSDIFKPTLNGQEIREDEIVSELGRGSVMDIFAQMECALSEL